MRKLPELISRVLLEGALDATQLLALAEQQAETLRQRAMADGRAEGIEQGRVEGLAEVLSHFDPREASRRFTGEEVQRLAFAIAERLLQRTLVAEPGYLQTLLAEQLELLGSVQQLRIRVNPAQRDLAEEIVGGRPALQAEIINDPSLSAGDCVVSGDGMLVDGRLTTRLSLLQRAMGRGGPGSHADS